METLFNNMIEKIYEKFYNEEDVCDLKETKDATDAVYEVFWDNILFEDIKRQLESAITDAQVASERQGFMFGFKKAMELMVKREDSNEMTV